ncbi:hypothetical protein BH20ACT22_BH20ACT22_16080 [soil metagenome]
MAPPGFVGVEPQLGPLEDMRPGEGWARRNRRVNRREPSGHLVAALGKQTGRESNPPCDHPSVAALCLRLVADFAAAVFVDVVADAGVGAVLSREQVLGTILGVHRVVADPAEDTVG